MRMSLLVISLCLFCFGCGVKNNPEYKSQNKYINIIKLT